MVLAREAGRVSVDDLALRFEVSPQTIRKDLNDLCELRLLARQHGGAMLASGVENLGYTARRTMALAEKQRIAARCASLIPDGSSLFLNIGTTTEEVARALVGRRNLLVVTNNIHVVSILLPCQGIEVVIAGGPVRRADGGIVGEATVDLVKEFKLDYAVIGCSGAGRGWVPAGFRLHGGAGGPRHSEQCAAGHPGGGCREVRAHGARAHRPCPAIAGLRDQSPSAAPLRRGLR
jgi:DeoR/GlpR family transcriptional regulator of sugar metabolism